MSVSSNDILFLSKILSFWTNLTMQEQATILDNTRFITYKAGDNVHGGVNDCIGVLLMKSGQLRSYIISEDGKEVTLYRLHPQDVCVLTSSCILENINFDIFVDAEKDTELYVVNAQAYEQLKKQNIHIANFTNDIINARFSDVMWVVEQSFFMNFDRRLALFLTEQAYIENSDTLRVTHDEIAKHMGTAREVVSRMLKYFENEGIVSLSRGEINILDKKQLFSIS